MSMISVYRISSKSMTWSNPLYNFFIPSFTRYNIYQQICCFSPEVIRSRSRAELPPTMSSRESYEAVLDTGKKIYKDGPQNVQNFVAVECLDYAFPFGFIVAIIIEDYFFNVLASKTTVLDIPGMVRHFWM